MALGSVLDWSYARLSRQQLVDARRMGYLAAMRYLGPDGRCITSGERDQILAGGLRIGPIWETTARRPMAGRQGGREDAVLANRWADRVGFPSDVPIVYAVDFGPTGAEMGTVVDYFRGVLETGGRDARPVGEYGPYPVVEALAGLEHAGRRVVWHWQTCGWSGLVRTAGEGSGGHFICTGETFHNRRRLSVHADLFQDLGARIAGTDHNWLLKDTLDVFTWHPDHPTAAPAPKEKADVTYSVIAHVDPSKSPRMKELYGEQTSTDFAFRCFDNGTMRQCTGEEVAELTTKYGVREVEDWPPESFWQHHTLMDRNYIGEPPASKTAGAGT